MRRRRIIILFMIFVFLIIGCFFTGEKVRMYVHENMSRQEVIDVLGNPDGFKRYEDSQNNNYILLTYTNKVISGWSPGQADYYFVFRNDQLSEWGTGEVRVTQSSTGMIMFVPIAY